MGLDSLVAPSKHSDRLSFRGVLGSQGSKDTVKLMLLFENVVSKVDINGSFKIMWNGFP